MFHFNQLQVGRAGLWQRATRLLGCLVWPFTISLICWTLPDHVHAYQSTVCMYRQIVDEPGTNCFISFDFFCWDHYFKNSIDSHCSLQGDMQHLEPEVGQHLGLWATSLNRIVTILRLLKSSVAATKGADGGKLGFWNAWWNSCRESQDWYKPSWLTSAHVRTNQHWISRWILLQQIHKTLQRMHTGTLMTRKILKANLKLE